MWQQSDSTATSQVAQTRPVKSKPAKLTPAQVARWLPKDATPAQIDSAIQRHIKPGPIHWSNRPDTLHLPNHPIGKSPRDVNLPQYYRESFFSNSPYYHPELPGGRYGVAGDPVPYTIAGDNLLTSLLLGCFILALVAFAKTRQFIAKQAKNFFYVPHGRTSNLTETGGEVRFQLFFVLQTCLLLAIIYFFYLQTHVAETFIIDQYQIIGLCAAIFIVYFILKAILYWITGWTFFPKEKNEQWTKAYLFIISMEGVLLFPLVIVLAYFGLPMQTAFIYTAAAIILTKILTFYKSQIIFFRQKGGILLNFLYFCTLELIPLLALWGAFGIMGEYLKINY